MSKARERREPNPFGVAVAGIVSLALLALVLCVIATAVITAGTNVSPRDAAGMVAPPIFGLAALAACFSRVRKVAAKFLPGSL